MPPEGRPARAARLRPSYALKRWLYPHGRPTALAPVAGDYPVLRVVPA